MHISEQQSFDEGKLFTTMTNMHATIEIDSTLTYIQAKFQLLTKLNSDPSHLLGYPNKAVELFLSYLQSYLVSSSLVILTPQYGASSSARCQSPRLIRKNIGNNWSQLNVQSSRVNQFGSYQIKRNGISTNVKLQTFSAIK